MVFCCPCLYPLWGLFCFAVRGYLWKQFAVPLLSTAAFTVVVLVLLYYFTYDLQVQLLESTGGSYCHAHPLGFAGRSSELCDLLGYALVPAEAGLLSIVFFKIIFGRVLGSMVVNVLVERGINKKLKQRCLPEFPGSGPHSSSGLGHRGASSSMAGSVARHGTSALLQVVLMVATAPLNAVPVVGQAVWVLLNGWTRTWDSLSDLLPAIGFSSTSQQFCHFARNPFSYSGFGAVAFVLELVPFLNVVASGGTAYGSARLFEDFLDRGHLGPDRVPLRGADGGAEAEAGSSRRLPSAPAAGGARGGGHKGPQKAAPGPQAATGAKATISGKLFGGRGRGRR